LTATIGNVNAPEAVTYSAIIYCLRCLISADIPLNQGCLKPIDVKIPPRSLLSPSESAAVVGGNVLTVRRSFRWFSSPTLLIPIPQMARVNVLPM
jgi:N-methylhydantoinase B/oxoprolinase/acetone carboxylase alpha subunit